MEKTLRVLGGDEESSGHSHSHSHSHSAPVEGQASGAKSSISANGLRARTSEKSESETLVERENPVSGPSKMSAYLNLFGDFVHNM